MAHTVDSRAETPANELRTLLDQAERQLPTLIRAEFETYLLRLDRIAAMLDTLEAEGLDLRAEQPRWEGLLARISARAADLVRIAGGSGRMVELRRQHPEAQNFWWRLDEQVAATRRRQLQRFVVGAVVAVIVFAGATLVYQRFFAPSPETILLMDTLNLVDRSVMEQDWASASQAVDSVLPTLPADAELLIWRAVLAERMGEPAAAEAFLAQARALEVDPARLGVMLGMKRLLAGDLDGASAAAADARQADPSSSEAVFILASVAEASGDRLQAINLFEEAAALAEENNPQMAVTSRMRLATLLQQGPEMFEPQATEPAP